MSVPLILVAASGLAREVISSVRAADHHHVVGVLDDQPALAGTMIGSGPDPVPVLGSIDQAAAVARDFEGCEFLVCVGKGTSRQAVVARLNKGGIGEDQFATVIDPSVRIPASCTVGDGSVLLANCVLTADVTLGRHVVAMPGVTLTHDNEVADFATLCAGVTLGGSVRVGEAAYLGMSSSVRERIVIGTGATLGMGSVLINDLPERATWVGVPARPLSTTRTLHS